MARAKQVARKAPASHLNIENVVASVSIINRSSETVCFASDDNIHCEMDESDDNNNNENYVLEYIYLEVEPGESHVATLRLSRAAAAATERVLKSIYFDLNDRPLVAFETHTGVASRREVKVEGQPISTSLVVVNNHENPPLTMEQLLSIHKEIHTFRETHRGKHIDTLWLQLAERYNRPNPVQLERLYHIQELNQFRTPSWFEMYQPVEPINFPQKEDFERLLKEPFTLHVYWRALDREPGGNASYFTIRYIFRLFPEDTKNKVTMEIFQNSDGDNTLDGPFEPSSVQSLNGAHEKIKQRILRQEKTNSTFHIVDTLSMDRASYNTEWSSVELIAFTNEFDPRLLLSSSVVLDELLKKSVKTLLMASNRRMPKRARLHQDSLSKVMSYICPAQPIFRLHQECCYGPQYRNTNNQRSSPPAVVEGNPEQSNLIQFVTKLVGMGRVCQLDCDGFLQDIADVESLEESRAAIEITNRNASNNLNLGSGYEFPIMFRW